MSLQRTTPPRRRPVGREEELSYTFSSSPFGLLLLAVSARGLCWLSIGASRAHLLAELRRHYPHARLRRGTPRQYFWWGAWQRWLAGQQEACDLPLDLRGTPFQLRVWEALRRIPPGQTRTYGEIAQAIGRPRAARAVGQACAANPLPLLIPCHRVIGSGGRLGGYQPGPKYKQRLLAWEARRFLAG